MQQRLVAIHEADSKAYYDQSSAWKSLACQPLDGSIALLSNDSKPIVFHLQLDSKPYYSFMKMIQSVDWFVFSLNSANLFNLEDGSKVRIV